MAYTPRLTGPESFLGKGTANLISFGSGWPDIAVPPEVFAALHKKRTEQFPYGEIFGNRNLREKIAQLRRVPVEGVGITNGASESTYLIVSGATKAHEKVLLTRPHYYSYPPIVTMHKCTPVFTELKDWHINLEDFEKKVKGCKVFILNSPANPTGSMESASVIKKIQKICAEQNVIMIFDEVYENFTYDEEQYSPRGDNIICVNSFSKTFGLCGLRIGYMYGKNTELIEQMMMQKTHTSMNTSTIGQEAALAALQVSRTFMEANKKEFRMKRDFLCTALEEMGLKVHKPEGAFYIPTKIDFYDPQKLLEELFYTYGVIVYNGEWFGMDGYLRFSFTSRLEVIKKGLERVAECMNNLRKKEIVK